MRAQPLLFLLGCARTTPPLDAARQDAHAILAAHCGACHTRHLPTAIDAALRVFDLDAPDWWAHLTPARLDNALWRLGEPLPPDGAPNDVSDGERARFRRFVQAERAAR